MYLGEWDFMYIHECEKKREREGKLISFCIPSMGFEKMLYQMIIKYIMAILNAFILFIHLLTHLITYHVVA